MVDWLHWFKTEFTASLCEHSNECLGSIKVEFLNCKYKLFRTISVSQSELKKEMCKKLTCKNTLNCLYSRLHKYPAILIYLHRYGYNEGVGAGPCGGMLGCTLGASCDCAFESDEGIFQLALSGAWGSPIGCGALYPIVAPPVPAGTLAVSPFTSSGGFNPTGTTGCWYDVRGTVPRMIGIAVWRSLCHFEDFAFTYRTHVKLEFIL